MRTPTVRLLGLALLLGAGLLARSAAFGQDALPSLAELDEGWNQLSPGGDTICSTGTPYSFFVRPGAEDKLMIHFEGGGACWNEMTCGISDPANITFDPTVADDELSLYNAGIFDFENEENPFQDYSAVFISYCTADVHMGNNVVSYGDVDVHHKGYVNATAALEWAYENFDTPETVFVNGCSAGALGSALHTPNIIERYSDAAVIQLGDAAGGYRADLSDQFTDWGTLDVLPDLPQYEGITAADLSFEDMYLAAAANYPDNVFSQINSTHDGVQQFFLSLVEGDPLEETLPANLSDIHNSAANFYSYTAWGGEHCVTPLPEFYTYRVGGVRLRDWVADLAAGEAIEDVQCTDCETEELYQGM